MSSFELIPTTKSALISAMKELKDIGRHRDVSQALFDSGSVFRRGAYNRLADRMKSGSNGVTGNLMSSINVRVFRNNDGVAVGFVRGVKGGNHEHLVDRGTTHRFRKKVGGFVKKGRYSRSASTGIMPANHFWTDTVNQDANDAMETLYRGIERGLEKISNRR